MVGVREGPGATVVGISDPLTRIPRRIEQVHEMVYFLYISRDDSELCFEFDEDKSRANEVKHGIGFVEAQALWLDEGLVEGPAKSARETRFLAVGVIDGKHWSAVVTHRGERIRLISVRRSPAGEVAEYEADHRCE
jgi:uncharacterized DUF497 family protein